MAPIRIAVSPDNMPRMLRTIVIEALGHEPGVEVVQSEGGDAIAPPIDVLITGAHPTPEALLREGLVKRLIEIGYDGRHATMHSLRHESWRVDDPSPARLVSLMCDADWQPSSGLLRRVSRWLAPGSDSVDSAGKAVPRLTGPPMRPELPHPEAAPQPSGEMPLFAANEPAQIKPNEHDPMRLELARLAVRILASRAESPEQAGPAAELATLARDLAAAGPDAKGGALPGVEHAVRCFGLRDDERDLLLLASLVEVDPRAARMVALLNDHMNRTRPTVGLVQDLGGQLDAVVERLVACGPLVRLGLISLEGEGPLSTRAIKVSDTVWPLLFGLQRESPFEIRTLDTSSFDALTIPDATRDACVRAAQKGGECPPSRVLVVVVGDAGVGRREMAQAIAAKWRPKALMIPAAAVTGSEVIAALSREALWWHAAVIVTDVDPLANDLWRALTERIEAPLLATASRDGLAALAMNATRSLVEVHAPRRDVLQRVRLWQARAPTGWTSQTLHDVAERFDFGVQQIDTALALARARATTDAPSGDAEPDDVRAACETLRETRFAGTAKRIECPFEPSDIVLRAETRRELNLAIAWARHASRLFSVGGAGAALRTGSGLACLFSGPPGSGKTMAAQIIARQVDFALFRVDLSQVVDKFIGETEKRMAELFDEAERARVALFFDEADALFGKRTEVRDSHDRYANITVDYLLQRIESFSGLAILATNFAGNIDDAFLRRVRIRATFPAPEAADRRRIWEKLLPPANSRASDIDIARLADPFELVGGEISNAIYTAHLLGAEEGVPLSMRHCVGGLWRELRKTGRIADVAHLGPWKSAIHGEVSGLM